MMRASKSVVTVFIAYYLFKLRGLRCFRNPPLTPPRRGTPRSASGRRWMVCMKSNCRTTLPSLGGAGGGFGLGFAPRPPAPLFFTANPYFNLFYHRTDVVLHIVIPKAK